MPEDEEGYISEKKEEEEEEKEQQTLENVNYDEERGSREKRNYHIKNRRRRSRTRSRSPSPKSPRSVREREARANSCRNSIESAGTFAERTRKSRKRRSTAPRRSSHDYSSTSNYRTSTGTDVESMESCYRPATFGRSERVSRIRGRSNISFSSSSHAGSSPSGGSSSSSSSFTVWGEGQEGTIAHRRRRRQRKGASGGAAAPCSYCGDELEHAVAVNIYVPGETRVNGEWKPNVPSARRNHRKFFFCVHFLADLVCNTRETEGSRIFVRTAGPKFVEYSPCGPRQIQYARKFIDCIRNGGSMGR